MKNLDSMLEKHMTNKIKRRKAFAAFVSLSLLVSFTVPLVLTKPAISAVKPDIEVVRLYRASDEINIENVYNATANNGNSPASLSAVALLIGSKIEGEDTPAVTAHAWTNGLTTAQEVVEAAKNQYFLGIASDFCIFLEDDFTPKNADCEGRVAVGGNIKFQGSWNYQVGTGDFATMTALKNTDNYKGLENFAHLIVGGNVVKINTLTNVDSGSDQCFGSEYRTDWSDIKFDGNIAYFPENEDLYKRIVLNNGQSLDDSAHLDSGQLVLYNDGCNGCAVSGKIAAPNELAQFYKANASTPLIDFAEQFKWMRQQSSKLADVESVKYTPTNSNWEMTWNGDPDAATVYFEIDEDVNWKNNSSVSPTSITFKKIPTNANIVVSYKGQNADFGSNTNEITTKIEEVGKTVNVSKDIYEDEKGKHLSNSKASERILYNFPNATYVYVDANVNGTIFAPIADVKSADGCNGHLSGSLIAKSFEGGLEFGYRPYRGGVDILPAATGYGIPISKVSEFDGKPVKNAEFTIYEIRTELDENKQPVLDEKNNPKTYLHKIDSFYTDKNGEAYVDLPSNVNFSNKDKSDENTKHYIIKETEAPAGYILDESVEYRVNVTENIKADSSLEGSRKVPTHIHTTIESEKYRYNADNGEYEAVASTKKTEYICIEDIYSYDSGNNTSKRVRRELSFLDTAFGYNDSDHQCVPPANVNVKTYHIDMDKNTDTIKSVSKVEGNPSGTITVNSNLTAHITGYDDDWSPYDPEVHNISALHWSNLEWEAPKCQITKATVYYVTSHGADSDFTNEVRTIEIPDGNGYRTENRNYNTSKRRKDSGTFTTVEYDTNTNTFVNERSNEKSYWSNILLPDLVKNNHEILCIDFYVKNTDQNTKEKCQLFVTDSAGNNITVHRMDVEGTPDVTANGFDLDGDGTAQLRIGKIPADKQNGTKWVTITQEDNGEGDENNNQGQQQTVEVPDEFNGTFTVQRTSNNNLSPIVEYAYGSSNLDCYPAIDGLDDTTKAQKVEGGKYYFDPETVMLVPMTETEQFTNKYGLAFSKVGVHGSAKTPLKNAVIEIQDVSGNVVLPVTTATTEGEGEGEESTTTTAAPDYKGLLNGKDSANIDISSLASNKVYKFVEKAAPNGYEEADPIYFYIEEDDTATPKVLKVHWVSSETAITTTTALDAATGSKEIDLTNPGAAGNKITMEDVKISGPKFKLGKYGYEEDKKDKTGYDNDGYTTDDLDGAQFQLFAVVGNKNVPVYPKEGTEGVLEVHNGGLDLYEFFSDSDNAKKADPTYVKNGYLQEGLYWLKETNAPDGYEGRDAGFKFLIEHKNGQYRVVPQEVSAESFLELDPNLSSDKKSIIISIGKGSDKVTYNDNNTTPLENVQTIHVICSSEPKSAQAYVGFGNESVSGGNGSVSYDKIGDYWVYMINAGGADLTKIKFNAWDNNNNFNSLLGIQIVTGDDTYRYKAEGASNAIFKNLPTQIVPSYKVNKIAWADNNSSRPTVDSVTYFYKDGTHETKKNITIAYEADKWYQWQNLPNNDKNVVGVRVVLSGSGNGTLAIQEYQNGWGRIWEQEITEAGTYDYGTVPQDFVVDDEPEPSGVTTYGIGDIVWSAEGTFPTVDSVTFYFAEGDPVVINGPIEVDPDGNYWHKWKGLGLPREGITGIKIALSGSAKAKIVVQNSGYNGNVFTRENATAGEVIFGTVPTEGEPQTMSSGSMNLQNVTKSLSSSRMKSTLEKLASNSNAMFENVFSFIRVMTEGEEEERGPIPKTVYGIRFSNISTPFDYNVKLYYSDGTDETVAETNSYNTNPLTDKSRANVTKLEITVNKDCTVDVSNSNIFWSNDPAYYVIQGQAITANETYTYNSPIGSLKVELRAIQNPYDSNGAVITFGNDDLGWQKLDGQNSNIPNVKKITVQIQNKPDANWQISDTNYASYNDYFNNTKTDLNNDDVFEYSYEFSNAIALKRFQIGNCGGNSSIKYVEIQLDDAKNTTYTYGEKVESNELPAPVIGLKDENGNWYLTNHDVKLDGGGSVGNKAIQKVTKIELKFKVSQDHSPFKMWSNLTNGNNENINIKASDNGIYTFECTEQTLNKLQFDNGQDIMKYLDYIKVTADGTVYTYNNPNPQQETQATTTVPVTTTTTAATTTTTAASSIPENAELQVVPNSNDNKKAYVKIGNDTDGWVNLNSYNSSDPGIPNVKKIIIQVKDPTNSLWFDVEGIDGNNIKNSAKKLYNDGVYEYSGEYANAATVRRIMFNDTENMYQKVKYVEIITDDGEPYIYGTKVEQLEPEIGFEEVEKEGGKWYYLTYGGERISDSNKLNGIKIEGDLNLKKDHKTGFQLQVGDSQTEYDLSEENHTFTKTISGEINSIWFQDYANVWQYLNNIKITTNGKVYTFNGPNNQERERDPEPETPAAGPSEGKYDEEHNILMLPNSPMGNTRSIKVTKKWEGDKGYSHLRPASVEVKLYRIDPTVDPVTETLIGTKTLTANNNWEDSWTGLATYVPESNPQTQYKYKVVETVIEGAPYEAVENNIIAVGSNVIVTNKLKTVKLKATKLWDTGSYGSSLKPEEITVKLEKREFNTETEQWSEWKSVSGSSLTLKASDQYVGYYQVPDVPGVEYRIVETKHLVNWELDTSYGNLVDNDNHPLGYDTAKPDDNDTQMSIRNKLKSGAIEIAKEWSNDSEGSRPEELTFELYQAVSYTNDSTDAGNYKLPVPKAEPKEKVITNYAKLMQYSLYFYDANMCGDVEGKTAVSWRQNCHMYHDDANADDPSRARYVEGGYHDAGDHAMFGLTQGFTAASLGWSYYEFKDAYNALDLSEHYQTIMKHFCDFFVASTEYSGTTVSDFMYQKGEAQPDHEYWGSPERQEYMDKGANGKSPSRCYWVKDEGRNGACNVAAEYAAALASYVLCFPDQPENAEYLNCAKALYNYAKTKHDVINVRSYDSGDGIDIYIDGDCKDDRALAAAWLYLATEDESYKTDCRGLLNYSEGKGYSWHDATLAADLIYAAHIDNTDATVKGYVTNWLNGTCTGSEYKILDGWGSARHNALAQQVALIASKNFDGVDYLDWSKGQMAYLLGDNDVKNNGFDSTCFVTGFAENSVRYTHHRGASVDDRIATGTGDVEENGYAHVLIGALAGGVSNIGNDYTDKLTDYAQNEVAIDYNAGLVGAAAGLYTLSKEKAQSVLTEENTVEDPNYPYGEVDDISYLSKVGIDITKYDSSFKENGTNNTPNGSNTNTSTYLEVQLNDTKKTVSGVLNIGDQRKLVIADVENPVWTSSDPSVVSVDENGIMTTLLDGNATLTANVGEDEYTVNVKVNLSVVTPTVSGTKIATIKVVASDKTGGDCPGWHKTIDNLPLTDAQGNAYVYYIKEVDSGTTDGTIKGKGDATYYPIRYSQNAITFGANDVEKVEVTNKKFDNGGVVLPSAGGTGTAPYTAVGAFIIGGALLAFFVTRRRRETE